MQFFDVHEQTKYRIIISKPETIDKISDDFISDDELKDLVGKNFWPPHSSEPRTYLLDNSITKELQTWADKLKASGKKTLLIEDDELLSVLKKDGCCIPDYVPEFGRHGDRICYSRRYKRVKKKPTLTDVKEFWNRIFYHAFYTRFGAWPPYVPTYNRGLQAFKAWKKCLGWTACAKHMHDPKQKKFYRMIWDNPQEYM